VREVVSLFEKLEFGSALASLGIKMQYDQMTNHSIFSIVM